MHDLRFAKESGQRLALRSWSREKQRGGVFFRLIFLGFVAALCFLVYLARHPLLRMAGHFWVVDDTPVASDAIFMLGDDNYSADRAQRAAQLYRAGWAPHVVASGRFLRPYASIAELEEHDLKDRGVPAAAILQFAHRGDNTREEALELARLIRERGWKKVLLVTSNYHTRRARYICGRVFPAGTELRVEAAPDSEFNPDDWWEHRKGLSAFFHETVGYVVAMWELHHGAAAKISMLLAVLKAKCRFRSSTFLWVYRFGTLYYSSILLFRSPIAGRGAELSELKVRRFSCGANPLRGSRLHPLPSRRRVRPNRASCHLSRHIGTAQIGLWNPGRILRG